MSTCEKEPPPPKSIIMQIPTQQPSSRWLGKPALLHCWARGKNKAVETFQWKCACTYIYSIIYICWWSCYSRAWSVATIRGVHKRDTAARTCRGGSVWNSQGSVESLETVGPLSSSISPLLFVFRHSQSRNGTTDRRSLRGVKVMSKITCWAFCCPPFPMWQWLTVRCPSNIKRQRKIRDRSGVKVSGAVAFPRCLSAVGTPLFNSCLW